MKTKNISKIVFQVVEIDESGLYCIISDENEKMKTSAGNI